MRILNLSIPFLLTFFLCSCADKEHLADKLYNEGYQHYSSKDFDKALVSFHEASSIYSGKRKGEVLMYIGSIMRQSNSYKKAIEYYTRSMDYLIEDQELLSMAMENTGRAYMEAQHYVLAEQYLIGAMKISLGSKSRQQKILNTLARNYKFKGELDKSLATFKRAANHSDKKGWVLNNIGNLFYELGQYDSAFIYFKEALQYKDDRIFTTYNNLAKTYKAQNILDSSYHYAKLSLIDENDQLHETLNLLTDLSLDLDNEKEALLYARQSLSLSKDKSIDRTQLEELSNYYQVQTALLIIKQKEQSRKFAVYSIAAGIVIIIITLMLIYMIKKYRGEGKEIAEFIKANKRFTKS